MFNKIKTTIKHIVYALLATGVFVSAVKATDRLNQRMAIVNMKPVYAYAGGPAREREETAPHFIEYSEVERTFSRSGKQ